MDNPTETPATPAKPKRNWKPIIIVVVLLLAIFGVRQYLLGQGREVTDNAQVSGDVVLVAPQVQGTISDIKVTDNELVREGQVLIQLDSSKFKAAVAQARANLDAAIAEAHASGIAVDTARVSSKATSTQAAGGVGQAEAGIGASKVSVATASAGLLSSQASKSAAEADVQNAQLARQGANSSLDRARANVEAAHQMEAQAKAAVDTAEAQIKAMVSQHQMQTTDFNRTKILYEEGVSSKQAFDRAATAEQTAASAEESARSGLEAAKAALAQRSANLKAAQADVAAAQSAIKQADVQIRVSKEKLTSANANVQVARLSIDAAKAAVATSEALRTQSLGRQEASNAGPLQVELQDANRKQAEAKVEQARAALATAELDLQHTTIVAPCDGLVSKRIAEEGSLAQPGGALLYIVPSTATSITANFKETQIGNIRAGQKVEIEIDGISGRTFEGHVDSVAGATGSTFALLPPDNASGNFVKVVQRVPVKIKLNSPSDQDLLRVGMSATVTVLVR